MFKYSVNLMWSDEDGCYVATIPEFPRLSAFGDTPEEAIKEAQYAAESFIEIYNEEGIEIPAPSKHLPFSGQTRIRIPKSLHAALTQEAKNDGISLNSYILHCLSKRHNDSRLKNIESLLKNFCFMQTSTKEETSTFGRSINWQRKEQKSHSSILNFS